MSDSDFEPDYDMDSSIAPEYEQEDSEQEEICDDCRANLAANSVQPIYWNTHTMQEYDLEEGEIIPDHVMTFDELVTQQIQQAHDNFRRQTTSAAY